MRTRGISWLIAAAAVLVFHGDAVAQLPLRHGELRSEFRATAISIRGLSPDRVVGLEITSLSTNSPLSGVASVGDIIVGVQRTVMQPRTEMRPVMTMTTDSSGRMQPTPGLAPVVVGYDPVQVDSYFNVPGSSRDYLAGLNSGSDERLLVYVRAQQRVIHVNVRTAAFRGTERFARPRPSSADERAVYVDGVAYELVEYQTFRQAAPSYYAGRRVAVAGALPNCSVTSTLAEGLYKPDGGILAPIRLHLSARSPITPMARTVRHCHEFMGSVTGVAPANRQPVFLVLGEARPDGVIAMEYAYFLEANVEAFKTGQYAMNTAELLRSRLVPWWYDGR